MNYERSLQIIYESRTLIDAETDAHRVIGTSRELPLHWVSFIQPIRWACDRRYRQCDKRQDEMIRQICHYTNRPGAMHRTGAARYSLTADERYSACSRGAPHPQRHRRPLQSEPPANK